MSSVTQATSPETHRTPAADDTIEIPVVQLSPELQPRQYTAEEIATRRSMIAVDLCPPFTSQDVQECLGKVRETLEIADEINKLIQSTRAFVTDSLTRTQETSTRFTGALESRKQGLQKIRSDFTTLAFDFLRDQEDEAHAQACEQAVDDAISVTKDALDKNAAEHSMVSHAYSQKLQEEAATVMKPAEPDTSSLAGGNESDPIVDGALTKLAREVYRLSQQLDGIARDKIGLEETLAIQSKLKEKTILAQNIFAERRPFYAKYANQLLNDLQVFAIDLSEIYKNYATEEGQYPTQEAPEVRDFVPTGFPQPIDLSDIAVPTPKRDPSERHEQIIRAILNQSTVQDQAAPTQEQADTPDQLSPLVDAPKQIETLLEYIGTVNNVLQRLSDTQNRILKEQGDIAGRITTFGQGITGVLGVRKQRVSTVTEEYRKLAAQTDETYCKLSSMLYTGTIQAAEIAQLTEVISGLDQQIDQDSVTLGHNLVEIHQNRVNMQGMADTYSALQQAELDRLETAATCDEDEFAISAIHERYTTYGVMATPAAKHFRAVQDEIDAAIKALEAHNLQLKESNDINREQKARHAMALETLMSSQAELKAQYDAIVETFTNESESKTEALNGTILVVRSALDTITQSLVAAPHVRTYREPEPTIVNATPTQTKQIEQMKPVQSVPVRDSLPLPLPTPPTEAPALLTGGVFSDPKKFFKTLFGTHLTTNAE